MNTQIEVVNVPLIASKDEDLQGMPKSDFYTEEEFKNATPERQRAAVVNTRVDVMAQRYHDALCKIVRDAAKLGLHIEIRTVSLQPLRMGNVASEVTVRPNLALWRELDALEKTAQLSELVGQDKAAARGDECMPPQSSPS